MPEVPFKSDLAQCQSAKPKWSDDLGGTIVLPNAANLSLDSESGILLDEEVDEILQPASTPSPSSQASAAPTPLVPQMKAEGTLYIVFVGCIDYFDQFHVAHRTSFCLLYNPKGFTSPNGNFVACQPGNGAD
jgi:hypothetical protein